jgi:DNA-binding transcriptional MerR regulator
VKTDKFRKTRRGGLRKAMRHVDDRDWYALEMQLAERQERIAQLEFEFSDTRADLARFENELERRLGHLQTRVRDLEDEINRASHQAARQAQWGDRLREEDGPVDVEEQYRKSWTSSGKPPKPAPKKPPSAESLEEQKNVFRQLAKRFHPDLVTNPDEKRWREKVMAEINQAYADRNLNALKKILDRPERDVTPQEKTRDQIMAELGLEIRRLDGVIITLERSLQQLINSHTVKLMLEVSVASRAGGDLIGEMAADLRAEIARLELDLASYS